MQFDKDIKSEHATLFHGAKEFERMVETPLPYVNYTQQMLTIREIAYTSQEHAALAFSRLTWVVDEVDGLPAAQTVEMNKDFVGILDDEQMTFTLMFPKKLFYLVDFQVIALGNTKPLGETSIINIKIKLGWGTRLHVIFLYAASALMIFVLTTEFNMEAIDKVLLFSLPPGMATWWSYKKLNLMERKVEELFNVG